MDLPDDNTPPKNLEEDLAAQATETDAPTAACGEDEAEEEAAQVDEDSGAQAVKAAAETADVETEDAGAEGETAAERAPAGTVDAAVDVVEAQAADETEEPGEEAEAKAEAPLDAEEAPVGAEEAVVQVEEAQTEGDTAKDAAGAGDGEDGALRVRITDEPLPALPVKVGDNTQNADYNTPSSAAYQHAHAALHLNCIHSHIRPLYVLMPTCTHSHICPLYVLMHGTCTPHRISTLR